MARGRRDRPSIMATFMPSSLTAYSSSSMATSGVCMGITAAVVILFE